MKNRFRAEKEKVFDSTTGVVWSVTVKVSMDLSDTENLCPSTEEMADILTEALNIHWPLREYRERWDGKPSPALIGTSMYSVHHAVARPGKVTFACSEKAQQLSELQLFEKDYPFQFCLLCGNIARDIDRRAELLLPGEFNVLKGEEA